MNNPTGMTHSIRRTREFLTGKREVLKLKDFEGLINVIRMEGWISDNPIELVDEFNHFYEHLKVTCTLTPNKEREHYAIELSVVSTIDGIPKPLSCNTRLVYSFKDDRLHQSIDLGAGVIVKSTVQFKEEAVFVSVIRSRLVSTMDFNLGVGFRIDKSLLENNQLVKACGYDQEGNFISVTGKGKVALIEDFIIAEMGYVPLDKELGNVFN